MRPRLTEMGFDPAGLRFALRTALACFLAVIIAWGLGLEHPQWSGMSVWAASQPLRGQLLEKSFFRLAGTVCGSVVGVLLVLAMQLHPMLLVLGLTAWVAACTWLGNLQRGLVGYGTVLAGYTAAMVALLDTGRPDQVLLLGADRLATVLTGVVVATLVGYFFAGRTDEVALRARTRQILAEFLRYFAEPVHAREGAAEGGGAAMLLRLAELEESLEQHGAGSLRSRRESRVIRRVLMATVPLLPQARSAHDRIIATEAVAALEEEAPERAAHSLSQSASHELRNLAAALQAWMAITSSAGPKRMEFSASPGPLHRDSIGAREAALRAGGAVLIFGLIWQMTGWGEGPYMLLGLTVMISLFSTFEDPAFVMRRVMFAQALGGAAALVCRWALWTLADTEAQLLLLMIPFLLFGALLVGHRRTTVGAIDYNMVFLLLLSPSLPLAGSFGGAIERTAAVLSGPVIAWLGYLFVFPIDRERRRRHLIEMMRQDLETVARRSDAPGRLAAWEARVCHRILRLARLSERPADVEGTTDITGRATLALLWAVMRLHELANGEEVPRPTRKIASLSLSRIARMRSRPAKAASAFRRLERRLEAEDAVLMRDAEAAVASLNGVVVASPSVAAGRLA